LPKEDGAYAVEILNLQEGTLMAKCFECGTEVGRNGVMHEDGMFFCHDCFSKRDARKEADWMTGASLTSMFASLFCNVNPAVANFKRFVMPLIVKISWRTNSLLFMIVGSPVVFLVCYATGEAVTGIPRAREAAARAEEVSRNNIARGMEALDWALLASDAFFAGEDEQGSEILSRYSLLSRPALSARFERTTTMQEVVIEVPRKVRLEYETTETLPSRGEVSVKLGRLTGSGARGRGIIVAERVIEKEKKAVGRITVLVQADPTPDVPVVGGLVLLVSAISAVITLAVVFLGLLYLRVSHEIFILLFRFVDEFAAAHETLKNAADRLSSAREKRPPE
jgi:hypothetical protein